MTADVTARVLTHRSGRGSVFCRRYGLATLAYAERHDTMDATIARENAIKAWRRAWKVELIESVNPGWRDLFDTLA